MATMTMEQKYYNIKQELKNANNNLDFKAIKRLQNKLTKWQQAYGAYAPITQTNFHKYD
jgi:hypothetical protein